MTPMPPPKADLDQVRNGTVETPTNPADWVNGNAGSSNSHYIEGQSIAYRMRLSNIAIGAHTIEVEWDIKHSSTNAIDYITTVVRTPPQNVVEVINPCRDVSPCTNAVSPTPLTGLNGFTSIPSRSRTNSPWIVMKSGSGTRSSRENGNSVSQFLHRTAKYQSPIIHS